MKFSVITPTRNSLDKLKRCVGSVRGQTGVALEHIVQDACSTDGTPEWLAAQPDLLARSEADDGMYDAINRGWNRSTGDILSWLNSDEQYLPGALELVHETFSTQPEIDFIYGNYIVVDGGGKPVAARREIRLSKKYISNGYLNAASCTMFFRRRLFDSGLLILDNKFRYASDMDLVLRLISSGAKAKHVNRYMALFAFDGSNLSCSPRMIEETEAIRAKFGGSSSPIARLPAMVGRIFERVIKGCYRPDNLNYQYVVNERPEYLRVEANRVSYQYVTQ